MNVLDNPVVSMVFNNASFEKNAGTSLETIAKLKEALNFEGAVRGLETIGTSLKNTGIDTFYTGVYKVKDEFNALEIVAARVLQNITDKIQGMVTNLASQAITKPLKDGFAEYELQMDSVQTIMASTGKSVGEVNGYLDELNEYADRTIYSFSDMTANIGKFTNAGVSLDKATAAIQGVSNVAAVSGAKTEEASRAMYNFAQALSAGSVKLIDWKSIENANMATVEFKEQLIQTAVAMGTLTKQGDDYISTTTDANGKVSEAFNATRMFNDSLSSQWMTTDVLVQTLQQYSTDVRTLTEDEKNRYKEQLKSIGYNDQQIESIIELGIKAANSAKDVKTFSQLLDTLGESLGSGWTKTWQLIIGDLNEAKVLWTGVNDVLSGFIDRVSDSRNSILDAWHKSGYTYNQYGELIKAFYDSEGKLVTKLPEDGKIFDKYGKEVEAVVDQETGEIVPQLIENGEKIREEMGGRDFVIGGLQKAYETFAEIMKEFGASWNLNFLGIDNKTIDNISITGEKLIGLSEAFYDSMSAFKEAWTMRKEGGEAEGLLAQLREQFDLFTESLRNGYDGIKNAFGGLGNIFNSFFRSDFFNIGTLNSAVTAFSAITGRIKDFGDAIARHFGPDKDFKNLNGLVKFFNGIQSVLESAFWVKLDFITNAFDALGSVVDHLISPFGTAAQLLGEIGLKLDEFGEAIHTLFADEDGSKFETMFQGMAEEFNNFVDSIRENIDFSGFSKIFDSIIKVMTDDNINLFGAFEKIFDSLLNVFEGFAGVVSPVVAAFANIFGDSIVEGATFFTQVVDKFHEFTELLIPSADTMKGIQTLFEGIFSVIKAIGEVLGASFLSLWEGLKSVFSAILPDGNGMASILETIGNSLKGFAEAIRSLSTGDGDLGAFTDVFGKFGKTIADFIQNVKDIGILQKAKDFLTDFLKSVKEHMFGSSEVGLLDGFGQKFKTFIDNIKTALLGDNGFDVGDLLTGAGLFAALRTILNWIKDMFGKDKEGPFASIVNTIKDVGEAITDTFGMIQDRLKFDALKSIATSILMIAGALFIISTIDTPKLFTALGAIAIMLKSMEQLMKSMNKLINKDNMSSAEIASVAAAIASIGTSILALAIAAKVLGSMKPEDLAKGLGAILVLLQAITKVAKEFSKFEGDIAKGSAGLIAMAIAVDLLAIAVKVLGSMDWKQLALGLGATIALIFSLAKAASLIGKDFSFGDGAGLIAMAYAIKILSGAVKTMGELRWQDLVKGLAGFAVVLGGLVGAMILLDQYVAGDELIKFGAGLLLLSIGLKEVAKAVTIMGSLELDQLVKGLVGLVVVLAAMVAASVGIEKLSSPEAVLALAGLSASLILLAGALKIVSTIPVPELIKAVGAIAATLGVLVLVSKAAAGSAAGIAALMGLAGAMALVGAAMLAFGAGLFLLSAAVSGGGSMLIAFLEQLIGLIPRVATMLGQGLIDFILTLANGAGKIADSVLTIVQTILVKLMTFIPTTLLQFATIVLTTLGQVLIVLIPVAVQILTTFVKSVLQGLQVIIPEIFALLQTILQNVLMFIQTNFPLIVQTLSVILQTILTTIMENAPLIGQTLLTLLGTVLNIISTAVPQIIGTLLSLILNLLQQLAEFVPQMADAALKIIGGFLQAVAENIQQITESAISIAIAFIDGITEKMPEIVDSAFRLLIGFIDGLAEAIDNNHQKLFDAVGHLIKAIFDAIVDGVKTIAKGAQELLTGFFGEFDISKIGQSLMDIGGNLVQGIIDGITGFAGNLWDSAVGLGKQLIDGVSDALGIHSPSKEGYLIGSYFDQGVANGVDDGANALYNKSANVAYGMLGAFGSALDEGSFAFNPSIDTESLKNKLSNTSYKYIPNDLMKTMTDMDSYSLDRLRFIKDSSPGLINDYNKLTRDQQLSDDGKQLLEMIDYDQRLEEYRNARIDDLVNQSNNSNTYNKKNLKQNTYNSTLLADNNKTSDNILVGVKSISGRLERIPTSSYDGITQTTQRSDSIKDELLSDRFDLIPASDRMELLNQIKDDSLDIMLWRKSLRPEQDPLWNDYYQLSDEDKNSFAGQKLLQMIDWNSAMAKYEDALIDEAYNNNSISEVYTSGELNNSITSLSDDISNISPNITSAIGQSININTDDLSSKISAQSDAITELGTTFNNGINRLVGASDDIVTVLGQGTNIYMDTGTLVGELAPSIDKELGFRSALVRRGVY